MEEVSLHGNCITYIALSGYGQSQVRVFHNKRIYNFIILHVKSSLCSSYIDIYMCVMYLVGPDDTFHKLREENGNYDSSRSCGHTRSSQYLR